MEPRNLFAGVPERLGSEQVLELLRTPGLTLERIVSTGQTTDWLDQDWAEWVLLIEGAARIEFADGAVAALGPGDFIEIPAHARHRVLWTDPAGPTVWLALHYRTGA